jgi:hypothetical protein
MLAGATAATTKLAYPAQNGHFFSGVVGAPGAGAFPLSPSWQRTDAMLATLPVFPAPAATAEVAWETM